MRRAGILIALALGACAAEPAPTPAPEPTPAPAPASAPGGQLAPPTPEDVAPHIRAADAGTVAHVRVGQRFAVELVGVPTAGYVWSADKVPDFLTASGETGGPTIAAQNQPGFAGGRHWEVLMFTAAKAGRGELALVQRRPWETNQPPADTFSVTIEAE
jgi:inhibitor of cysteine peptidase